MSRIRSVVAGDQTWFIALLGLAVLARLYNFGQPPDDAHEWRQTQTLMYAASYSHGAGLLTPHSNWNGVPSLVGVLEFPIYSILVHWLSAAVDLVTAGRVVSLLCSLSALFLFDRLCAVLEHPHRRTATLLFAFTPVIVFYGHAAQPEALLLLLLVATAYCTVRSRESWAWTAGACFSLAVAATIKPSALIALFPSLVYLAWRRRGWVDWVCQGIVLAIAGISVVAWGAFTREVLVSSDPNWYTTNTNPAWVFGPLSLRFSSEFYLILIARLLTILLPFAAVVFVVAAGRRRAGHPFWWWWLAGSVGSVLVFANLNEIHFYYQLPLIPALAALAAYGAPAFPSHLLGRLGVVAALVAALVLGSGGLYAAKPINFAAGTALGSASSASPDKAVIVISRVGASPNWPTVLFYAGRDGWNLPLGSDASRIQSLPGQAPCWMVIVLDGSGGEPLPAGWRETKRRPDYVLAYSDACQ